MPGPVPLCRGPLKLGWGTVGKEAPRDRVPAWPGGLGGAGPCICPGELAGKGPVGEDKLNPWRLRVGETQPP